jgi:ABC-type nitrate/sulfonate/bicarbonate transport system substrate-binding protein
VAALKKRNLIVIAVVILVVAIVLSSFVYLNSPKPFPGKIESITIGTVPNETNSLIYVANDQKYFAANGLNITLKSYASGLADAKAVLNGEINIGIATEFIVAEEAFDNASLYVLGTDSKFSSFSMVARTDQGINGVADLNGKTIGVAFGTIAQFYLGRFLELNNLNLSEVTLVNVPFAQSQSALANGTINAVLVLQPFVSQIENALGNKVVTWPAQSNQLGYNDLVCTRSWAQQHSDLVVRFLKSLISAEDFVINHQNQSIDIVTKALNYSSTYLPPLWSNYQFTVSLDQSQILAMQDESRWLIQNNLTNASTIPGFLNYIYFDGLETVKPTSVNILR